jgi:hypothetical protein
MSVGVRLLLGLYRLVHGRGRDVLCLIASFLLDLVRVSADVSPLALVPGQRSDEAARGMSHTPSLFIRLRTIIIRSLLAHPISQY